MKSQQTDWLQAELNALTSSPEDFPARTLASQATEPACSVSAAACGPSFFELSLKSARVGQLLRMYLALGLSERTGFAATWQEQTTPIGRWWWVLDLPEHPINGNAFGWLPTLTAQSYGRNKGGQNLDGPERPSLETMAKGGMLPTPTATDSQNRGYYQYSCGDHSKPVLALPGAVGAASSPQYGTGTGRLSPCFVEWMMGYPEGWTDVDDTDASA